MVDGSERKGMPSETTAGREPGRPRREGERPERMEMGDGSADNPEMRGRDEAEGRRAARPRREE